MPILDRCKHILTCECLSLSMIPKATLSSLNAALAIRLGRLSADRRIRLRATCESYIRYMSQFSAMKTSDEQTIELCSNND